MCDGDFRIKIAIELDDRSHDSELRKERDEKVNTLFKESGIPLVRIRDISSMTDQQIKDTIYSYIWIDASDDNSVAEHA